jgi:hypothetical protein
MMMGMMDFDAQVLGCFSFTDIPNSIQSGGTGKRGCGSDYCGVKGGEGALPWLAVGILVEIVTANMGRDDTSQ